MKKWLLGMLIGLALSTNLYAQTVTIPKTQYDQIVTQLEQLITTNKALMDKVQELQKVQSATPTLTTEPLVITVDKAGEVFVKDQLVGKLQVADLQYDVKVQIKPEIVKAPSDDKEVSWLNLRLKCAIIESYEAVGTETQAYTSGALAIEPLHYKNLNINAVVGNRLYGAAVGMDLTNHMDALLGVGMRYNDTKVFFLGAGFDL